MWAASGLVSASHQARSLSSHPSSIQHALTPRTARARGRAVRIPARGTEKAMHSLSIPRQRTQPAAGQSGRPPLATASTRRCRAQIPPMRAARGPRHRARARSAAQARATPPGAIMERRPSAPRPALSILRWLAGWLPACLLGLRSWHVEAVAALAPPRLRVVLGSDGHARRHGHVHRVAGAAVAALGRAPWRV